jgi:acyl-CoA thioesterase
MPLTDTTVVRVGPSCYETVLPEDWVALQGVHGGFVAALAVQAIGISIGDPVRTMRAGTFGFLRGLRPEPATIEVTEVRTGRALATYDVAVNQGGPPSLVGRCHFSPPWDGIAFSDLEPPALTRPDDAVRLVAPGGRVGHFGHLDTWVDPETTLFAGAPVARWKGWTRPDGDDVIDTAWLTLLGDYFPPAVTVRNTGPTRAVSIEYAIQIHTSAERIELGADEYLACEMHTTHAAEGFAVEDGSIWGPDGTLLATTRQTRLAG